MMACMSNPDPEASPADAVQPTSLRSRANPENILLSKWTAATLSSTKSARPVKTFGPSVTASWHAAIASPEATVAIFALLLNFPWEILQAPLFAGMASSPHAEATRACLRATIGDMVIMLGSYAVVAVGWRNRRWMVTANGAQLALFIGIGLSVTVLIEWLAAQGRWVSTWSYLPAMPLLPGTGIGLMPVWQWLTLPLLTVWFVRRQLAGSTIS
jgi:hypothetical protein